MSAAKDENLVPTSPVVVTTMSESNANSNKNGIPCPMSSGAIAIGSRRCPSPRSHSLSSSPAVRTIFTSSGSYSGHGNNGKSSGILSTSPLNNNQTESNEYVEYDDEDEEQEDIEYSTRYENMNRYYFTNRPVNPEILDDLLSKNRMYEKLLQVMSVHPNYLEPFLKTHNFIMRGNGPLTYPVRHYIAIMAAARHSCSYLVNIEKVEFISVGGDVKWLNGIQNIPLKLKDLNEINKLLAHQPWKITSGHIKNLAKGGTFRSNGSDNWSVGEIVHSLIILTHFHALSSFVFSAGINDHHDHGSSSDNSTKLTAKVLRSKKVPTIFDDEDIEVDGKEPVDTFDASGSNLKLNLNNTTTGSDNHQTSSSTGIDGQDGKKEDDGKAKEMVSSPSCQMIKKAFVDDSPPPELVIGSPLNEGSVEVLMAKMRTISEIRDRTVGQFSPPTTATSDQQFDTKEVIVENSKEQEENVQEHYSCSLYPEMDTDSNPDPELIDDQNSSLLEDIVDTSKPLGTTINSNDPNKRLDEVKENFPPKIGGISCYGGERSPGQLITIGPPNLMPQVSPDVAGDILKFVEDASFNYVDFARRISGGGKSRHNHHRKQTMQQTSTTDSDQEQHYSTLRTQDYSWDDQGYCLVNQLYYDVGSLLDEKFKTAYNMTYFTMGRLRGVDTSLYRRAIWNYILCIYGIRHDDYDYREVNLLLDRDLKTYIKVACCFPSRTGRTDCDKVMPEFRRSEKTHVNLMIAEARNQAELLYALRAVMAFMT